MRVPDESGRLLVVRSLGRIAAFVRDTWRTRPLGFVRLFLFGSATRPGDYFADSDVDVGVVFSAGTNAGHMKNLVAELNRKRFTLHGHRCEFVDFEQTVCPVKVAHNGL